MNTNLINPLVLAYIGDAIYELEIRTRLVNTKINKVNDLQKESIKYVSAKSQANYINVLIDANVLTEDEIDIYKRARNTKVNSHPSSTDIITYKKSTGFECLVGYLYLSKNINRLDEIMNIIKEEYVYE